MSDPGVRLADMHDDTGVNRIEPSPSSVHSGPWSVGPEPGPGSDRHDGRACSGWLKAACNKAAALANRVGSIAVTAGKWTYEHRNQIVAAAGFVAMGACIVASVGACAVVGAVAVGIGVANRAVDLAQTKRTRRDWANFAVGLDIGVSRIPGARQRFLGY
jgi:hypothetical protein